MPLDRPLITYAGIYVHAGYGELSIQLKDDGLQAIFNEIEMPMEYTGNDTFSVLLVLFGLKITFTFQIDQENNTHSISIPFLMEPGAKPIEFIKKSEE